MSDEDEDEIMEFDESLIEVETDWRSDICVDDVRFCYKLFGDDIKSSSKNAIFNLLKIGPLNPSPSIFNCYFSSAADTVMPSIY